MPRAYALLLAIVFLAFSAYASDAALSSSTSNPDPLCTYRDASAVVVSALATSLTLRSAPHPPAVRSSDGMVLEPAGGLFDVVCEPSEGGAGIQRAIDFPGEPSTWPRASTSTSSILSTSTATSTF